MPTRSSQPTWPLGTRANGSKTGTPVGVALPIAEAGGGGAVMVGDSTWDCEAAARCGVETIALLTGGFSEQELRDAGATEVFESLEDLLDGIDRTPLKQPLGREHVS